MQVGATSGGYNGRSMAVGGIVGGLKIDDSGLLCLHYILTKDGLYTQAPC